MLHATATDSTTLGAFDASPLNSNVGLGGTGYWAPNYVQNATFIDYNRDGRPDLFAIDMTYEDGQQMFYNDGSGWIPYQVGALPDAPQYGDFAPDGHTQGSANTWSWYGGIIGIDKNGDGYVDIIYGEQTPNDGARRGGPASQIVLNHDGTVFGMDKDATFANEYNNQVIGGTYVPPSRQRQSQPDMELSGVDLNNDGRVDFVMHGTNVVSPGSTVNATGALSANLHRLVVVEQTADDDWAVTQIINNVFQLAEEDPGVGNAVSMTWADFNGDGYMDLFMGRGYGTSLAAQYYFPAVGREEPGKYF